MTVWKFELPMNDTCCVAMPKGCVPLFVGEQRNTCCVWCLCDPTADKVSRLFRIAGTGHPIDPADTKTYIGSVLLLDGSLVFHVFDLGEIPAPVAGEGGSDATSA